MGQAALALTLKHNKSQGALALAVTDTLSPECRFSSIVPCCRRGQRACALSQFQQSKLFEQLFEEIVARCLQAGLVRGDNLSVDGSFVETNAAKESRIPREQFKRHECQTTR